MHVMIPETIISMFGFDLSGEAGGAFFQKIHPGTYLILISFLLLLTVHANPLLQFIIIASDYTIYTFMLLLYVMIVCYWAYRGASGLGVIFETHLPVPICAIVLSYAPYSQCRRAIMIIILLAVCNSIMGIIESIWQFRFFPPSVVWVEFVGYEFRASAILGHPLNNAMFTSVTLLVAMAVRISPALKVALLFISLASLLAFGGRAGIAFTLASLVPLAFLWLRGRICSKSLTMRDIILMVGAMVIVPTLVVAGMAFLLSIGVGGRLLALSSLDDSSAQARVLAWQVFDYLSTEEIIFGVGGDRIMDVTERMGLLLPFSDIENPWLLMLLLLGAIFFTLWLIMTIIFIVRLLYGKPLAMKMAVMIYFAIASTSNSFGRKDSIYAFTVAAIICAARTLKEMPSTSQIPKEKA